MQGNGLRKKNPYYVTTSPKPQACTSTKTNIQWIFCFPSSSTSTPSLNIKNEHTFSPCLVLFDTFVTLARNFAHITQAIIESPWRNPFRVPFFILMGNSSSLWRPSQTRQDTLGNSNCPAYDSIEYARLLTKQRSVLTLIAWLEFDICGIDFSPPPCMNQVLAVGWRTLSTLCVPSTRFRYFMPKLRTRDCVILFVASSFLCLLCLLFIFFYFVLGENYHPTVSLYSCTYLVRICSKDVSRIACPQRGVDGPPL